MKHFHKVCQRLLLLMTHILFSPHQTRRQKHTPRQQSVYFANHSSMIDTLIIWAALPENLRANTRPIAARDTWNANRLNRFIALHLFRALLLDRETSSPSLTPLYQALNKGTSLLIYPEGTRGHSEDILPFKSGLYYMAKHFPNIELIPVHLKNTSHALPKGKWLPLPLECSVAFGSPLHLLPNERKQDFLIRARNALIQTGPSCVTPS